jgi:hypothetical protein
MAAGVTGKQNAVKVDGEEIDAIFIFLLPHFLKCGHLGGNSSSLLLMLFEFFSLFFIIILLLYWGDTL